MSQPAAEQPNVNLALEPSLLLGNATLFVGKLDLGDTRWRNPGMTGARSLGLPSGELVVCPLERGTRGLIPTLQELDPECKGAVVHRDPQIRFGVRTWVQMTGNYTPGAPPAASLSVLVPKGPQGGPVWAAVPVNGTLPLSFAQRELRFACLIPSSQVLVDSGRETFTYNGTEFGFLFNGTGEAGLAAEGLFTTLRPPVTVRLAPANPRSIEDVLAPRVLLDVEEAMLGADARESVRNVTQHLQLARSRPFLNGAILGRLNGTVGGFDLSGTRVAHARFASFEGGLDRGRLVGSGDLDLLLTAKGVSLGGEEAGTPPWSLAAVLWVVGGVLLFAGRRWLPQPVRWRAVDWALPLVAFVVWDRIFAAAFGTSAIDLARDPVYGWGTVSRLALFELVALTLAWVLLYVPLRVVSRRLLPPKLSPFASLPPFFLLLIFLLVSERSVVALGLLVARL